MAHFNGSVQGCGISDPLLMQWRFHSLTQSHWFVIHHFLKTFWWKLLKWTSLTDILTIVQRHQSPKSTTYTTGHKWDATWYFSKPQFKHSRTWLNLSWANLNMAKDTFPLLVDSLIPRKHGPSEKFKGKSSINTTKKLLFRQNDLSDYGW